MARRRRAILREVLEEDIVARASFLMGRRLNTDELAEALGNAFPQTGAEAISDAIQTAAEARAAGRVLGRRPRAQSVSDERVPVNPSIAEQYRYIVTVCQINPDTGLPQYRSVVIDSPTRLSRGELERTGEQQASNMFRYVSEKDRSNRPIDEEDCGVIIESVERRQ